MLKIFSHIALSLLLLVSTVGMTVSKHYCGNSLVSVSISGNSEESSCCDMENCCHSETQIFQLKEDFSVPAVSGLPVSPEINIWGHDLAHLDIFSVIESMDVRSAYTEIPPLLPILKTLSVKEVYLL